MFPALVAMRACGCVPRQRVSIRRVPEFGYVRQQLGLDAFTRSQWPTIFRWTGATLNELTKLFVNPRRDHIFRATNKNPIENFFDSILVIEGPIDLDGRIRLLENVVFHAG